jgi:hypothetical protein
MNLNGWDPTLTKMTLDEQSFAETGKNRDAKGQTPKSSSHIFASQPLVETTLTLHVIAAVLRSQSQPWTKPMQESLVLQSFAPRKTVPCL